jgi:ribosomal protein S14
MRCQICGETLRGSCYTISALMLVDTVLVLNICRPCLRQLCGSPAVNRLDIVLARTAFKQEKLPEPF